MHGVVRVCGWFVCVVSGWCLCVRLCGVPFSFSLVGGATFLFPPPWGGAVVPFFLTKRKIQLNINHKNN